MLTPDDRPSSPPIAPGDHKELTGRQAYNIASDLGVGVNVRLKDNVFQGVAIFVCLIIGVIVGFIVTSDRLAGALVGALIGLIVGLFGSGIFLMIYRMIMHFRGKHD